MVYSGALLRWCRYAVYGGTLLIRNDADGKSYLYDLLDVEKKKVISKTSFSAETHSEVTSPKPSGTSIPADGENVKPQFSLKAPVEETKNLLVLHNLTEKNLLDAAKLGGLPMPSIAIVKADEGHGISIHAPARGATPHHYSRCVGWQEATAGRYDVHKKKKDSQVAGHNARRRARRPCD